MMLEPLLANGYVLAALAPMMKRAPKIVVEKAAALHPLTYLPFHLIGGHLTARLLPNKRFTYPAQMAFAVTQYAVEHFSAELPSVAAFGPALVAIALSQAPYIYYRAFKLTAGSKALVWAALLTFFPILFFFKGLELGFPKDTPEEQAIANLDRAHSLWHLLLHVVLLGNQLAVSAGVPWTPPTTAQEKKMPALVPPSPDLSTRRRGVPTVSATLAEEQVPCSPATSAKKRAGFAGNWAAKPKAA